MARQLLGDDMELDYDQLLLKKPSKYVIDTGSDVGLRTKGRGASMACHVCLVVVCRDGAQNGAVFAWRTCLAWTWLRLARALVSPTG